MFNSLFEDLFALSDDIRYVAVYDKEELVYRQRDPELEGASSGGTDRFEELLVNPTLLTLARQRGNIDCGGLEYLLIRYGNFFQWVQPTKNGHISVCLNKLSDLNTLPQAVAAFLRKKYPDFY